METKPVHIQALTMDNCNLKIHVSTWSLGLSMILQIISLCPLMAFTVQHRHVKHLTVAMSYCKQFYLKNDKEQTKKAPFLPSIHHTTIACLRHWKHLFTWLITQYLFLQYSLTWQWIGMHAYIQNREQEFSLLILQIFERMPLHCNWSRFG